MEAKKPRTLAQLAQEALNVQDACNLSGVVHGWSRAMKELHEALPGASTDEINRHFVNQLWADKVAHLTGTQSIGNNVVMAAYDAAHVVIKTEAEETKIVDGIDKAAFTPGWTERR
jgi:hypothetical protein